METIDRNSPERLPGESARAYRAFSAYRDLGPGRSHDKAWKSLGAEKPKDRASARRPGHWTKWSTEHNWVERAEAHDELIDEERRAAEAARREALQVNLTKFRMDQRERTQDLALKTGVVLNTVLTTPSVVITKVDCDKVTGIKTTTKLMPLNVAAIVAVSKAWDYTVRLAVEGLGIEEPKEKEKIVERVFWIKAPESAEKAPPESGRQQPQTLAEFEARLANSEEDPKE